MFLHKGEPIRIIRHDGKAMFSLACIHKAYGIKSAITTAAKSCKSAQKINPILTRAEWFVSLDDALQVIMRRRRVDPRTKKADADEFQEDYQTHCDAESGHLQRRSSEDYARLLKKNIASAIELERIAQGLRSEN